jgi:DNA-binding NarL/FixJ family response regulator
MPALNGIEAGRAIREACPDVKLVALTEHIEDSFVLDALEAGFRGYVSKVQAVSELVRALDEVSRGSVFLSPGLSDVVVDRYLGNVQAAKDSLTPREREVLQLVAESRTTKDIARELGIGVKTVESHRTRIMTKLGIHETAGLVRYAIRRGLIKA